MVNVVKTDAVAVNEWAGPGLCWVADPRKSAPGLDSRSATEELWQYERLMFDFSGGYRISHRYELTLTGRNILNSPIARYSNEPGRLRAKALFGPAWTLGIRGRW